MPMKILIVDDEPHILDVLLVLLNSQGFTTVTATNGQQALKKLKVAPYSVVITDLKMPIMDGVELIKKIRHLGFTLPIVVSAGHMDETLKPMLEKYNINAFLHKPYGIQAVLDTLHNIRSTHIIRDKIAV